MANLNIDTLKNNREEILKAEIGTLLFNLGKTHIGFWKGYKDANGNNIKRFSINETDFKNQYGYEPFDNYKDYYTKKLNNNETPFEIDIKKTDSSMKLKKFFDELLTTKIFDDDGSIKNIKIIEMLKGGKSNKKIGKQIFFRGCENINSGIDKGSPQDSNQLKTLWLSNAFGSFKRKIEESDFDQSRLCFFQNLHRFLGGYNYYDNPDWIKIRDWILDKIKSWYSRLLSDSRFPINDVSLWDQAFMSAAMFKAALAEMFLDNSIVQNYINNPTKIRWRILGIQYDKLSLAERGFRPAQIKWYCEVTNAIDEEVKKLLDIEYTIGNEIYRDETGIYFLVNENLGKDTDGYITTLVDELSELKEKVLDIFKNNTFDEFYPAIFLTKASRGLMNLGYLVEKAKENFLKADYSKKDHIKLRDDDTAIGICPVCQTRLVYESDKKNQPDGPTLCSICYKAKTQGKIKDWVRGETIWTGELQDKNGRIALVTLKFELMKWLNGDLLNSLVINNDNYPFFLNKMKETLKCVKFLYSKNAFSIASYKNQDKSLNEKLLIELEKNLYNTFSFDNRKIGKLILTVDTANNKVELKDKEGDPQNNKNLLNNDKFKELIRLFDFKIFKTLAKDAYSGCKNNNETFEDFIRQIFFGSIIGNDWELFIKGHSLSSNIDFKNRAIEWNDLSNSDIDFLSQLILQFLLRKNPSPARLRRIWETTKEFFNEIGNGVIEFTKMSDNRKIRYYWENIDLGDGEYVDGNIHFWVYKNTVYMITPIVKIPPNKDKFFLKKRENNEYSDNAEPLDLTDRKEISYKPYLSIINPTPISWQFAIPAEYISNLIKEIDKFYKQNFKWVYGKLPLHIGVIFQDYKKPLYVGIKALRKIRRDGVNWQDLGEIKEVKHIKAKQKEAFYYTTGKEKEQNTEDFYSFFERADNQPGQYEFYISPNENCKKWIDITQNTLDVDKFYFYPNTIDFEFMDTNTRRNDIYYKKTKRFMKLRSNRPYDLDDFQYFKKFRSYFSDKKLSSKLQKLVSLIYSKLEDWKGDNESIKTFILSSFINILELNNNDKRDSFASVTKCKNWQELEEINSRDFEKKLYMILDMFDFWHTILKEV